MINNSRRGSAAIIIFIVGAIFALGGAIVVSNPNLGNEATTQIAPQVSTLPAPTNFTLVRTSNSNVSLSWQYGNFGQSGFKIERTTDTTCSSGFSLSASALKDVRTKNDAVTSYKHYCYRMRAYSGSGSSIQYSPYSNFAGDSFMFTSSVASTTLGVNKGQSVSTAVYLNVQTGNSKPVGLSASGIINFRGSVTFSPYTCTPNCTSVMTITTYQNSPIGSYPITVIMEGVNEDGQRVAKSIPISLQIFPAPIPTPITYTLTTNANTVYPGQTFIGGITITGTNQVSRVQFSGGSAVVPIINDTTYPYSFSLPITTSTPKGQQSFFAEVFDLSGARMTFVGPKYFTVAALPASTPIPRFNTGDTVKVIVTGGLYIRAGAGGPIIDTALFDARGRIIGGPAQAGILGTTGGPYTWWKIEWFNRLGQINDWSMEGANGVYYLEKVISSSPIPVNFQIGDSVISLGCLVRSDNSCSNSNVVGMVASGTIGTITEYALSCNDMQRYHVNWPPGSIVNTSVAIPTCLVKK